MLSRFLWVWIAYWVVVWLLPVSSIYEAKMEAFLLQVVFVLLVFISMLVVLAASGVRVPPARSIRIPGAESIAWIGLALSVAGFAALLFDKIYIQGVDYSDGISVAREQWRRLGEDRAGQASSWFSAFGYLAGSFYFVSAVLACTQLSTVRSRSRFWLLVLSFVLLMANAVLTGGRSNILLMGAFLLAAVGLYRGIRIREILSRVSQRLLIRVTVLAAVAYTVAVFYFRAEAGGTVALSYYVFSFLPYLGLHPTPDLIDFAERNVFADLGSSLVLALSYLTHSFSTTAAIVEHGVEDKTVVFIHASNLLYKVGLMSAPESDWFLAGRFPSLPGALWLQFGWLGFATTSVVLGVLSALVRVWQVTSPERLLPMAVSIGIESVLILSPALVAVDVLSFPFVMFAFVSCAVFQSLVRDFGRRPTRIASQQSGVH